MSLPRAGAAAGLPPVSAYRRNPHEWRAHCHRIRPGGERT
jgi:hypothetical protein